MHPDDFRTGSIVANLRAALQWLAEGRVRVEGLYETASPHDAPQAYRGLIDHSRDSLTVVFYWSKVAFGVHFTDRSVILRPVFPAA